VDAGNYLMDERGHHGVLRPDSLAKNEEIEAAYTKVGVDVRNLSAHELRYASRYLKASHGPPPESGTISANIVADSAALASPQPMVVKEVASGERKLKVSFIGLTEATPAPPPGFRITDSVGAARSTVAAARKKSDVVIVLARVKPDEARRIAQTPGIDLLIAASADSLAEVFTPPETVGSTQIVYTSFETRMLGEVRFYQSGTSFTTRVRYISLDDGVPDDPGALQLANRAKQVEEEAQAESKNGLQHWLEKSRGLNVSREADGDQAYAGAAKCAGCHQGQYIKWSSSRHAHATEPLLAQPVEFEMSCLQCHASHRGSSNPEDSGQGVDCERCHGPGAEHSARPAKGYGRISGSQVSCYACHSPATDRGFELQKALAAIKH